MLSKLNPEQRDAARYLDGPLLVLAGAGSGKTRVITHKIAYLVRECGYAPQNIAAITFTNKAAREMQERVGELLEGQAGRGLTVSTFHSLGLTILRHEARTLGYKPQFSVFDSADAGKVISDIVQTTDKQLLRQTQSAISNWKNAGVTPSMALTNATTEAEMALARAYLAYCETLKAYQATDFDDLIGLPLQLFEQHAEIREKWQKRLRYLLVDEYQDTNDTQYRLLKLLAGAGGAFTAVGDDDQSIYAWRGAKVENLRQLKEDYRQLHLIKLEQNYRSTVRILKAANTLIANNPKLFEKRLWSELGTGEPIQVVPSKDDDHEAELVVTRMLAHKFESRTTYSDYAILYRSNHQARVFEQQLRNAKVPYTVSGGTSFFDRAEIKDVVAYLRLIANEDDDPAFIRAVTTPKRGIGAQTLERLGNYAAERHLSLFAASFEAGFAQQVATRHYELLIEFGQFINRQQARASKEPAGELLRDLLNSVGYEVYLYDQEEQRAAETKWKNVLDFVGWISRKGEEDEKTLIALTQTIALMNLLEGRDKDEIDAVRLSTLHAAKGLEFKHVYLVGVEEGILPHRESVELGNIEEERRLMYVGITRAQQTLTVSHCAKRKRGGEWVPADPSRFIAEMGDDLRHFGRPGAETTPEGRAEGSARLANLKALLGR